MLLFFVIDQHEIICEVVTLERVQTGSFHGELLIPYVLDEDKMWKQPERINEDAVGMHLYEYTDRNPETLRKLRT